MSKLAPMQLLELWERGASCGPHERALNLLLRALPGRTWEELADLDLGSRDWHLLHLRHVWFGPSLAARGLCPSCQEQIEVELDARQLQASMPPDPAPLFVDDDGRRYRLPSSRDLLSLSATVDLDSAANALFEACCLDAGETSAATAARVEEGLSALAAERGIQLALQCEVCGETWTCAFDPGAFFWEEIDTEAQAVLDEVHLLAKAYGWNEAEVLSLSHARRNAYLERVL